MPYPQLVSQNYNNLGGINEKASEYTTQRTQFLKLFNVDFRVPNALKKRDGSTQAILTGTSGAITSMYEYIKNDGSSYMFSGTDVGLFQSPYGSTFQLSFSTSAQFDFVTYDDQMWAANGTTFVNFNGSTFYPFGAPPFLGDSIIASSDANTPSLITGGIGFSFGIGATKTIYYYLEGVKNNSQIINAPFFDLRVPNAGVGGTFIISTPASYFTDYYSVGLSGVYVPISLGENVYGIDSVNIYRKVFIQASLEVPGVTLTFAPRADLSDWSYLGNAEITGATGSFTDTFGDSLVPIPAGPAARNSDNPFWYYFLDQVGASTVQGATLVYVPEFIETYNNAMFMAGFSAFPSRLWFSEIGEPEYVLPENFIDVKTNDGDKITGTKTYLDQHLIFKEKSFHRITGDDATNYTLTEVTSEYGALNNKCIVEAENILYFLDNKGIVKYNGTSWFLQSYPIEDTVNRINISAAKTDAFAVHKKKDNQVWFAVPLDAATENNVVLVYDYVLDAWTMHDSFSPSSFAVMKGGLSKETLHFGSYSGLIHNFDEDLRGDNGNAFTCLIHGRYEAAQGQNVEKLFRRLFTDIQVNSTASTIINVKGYKNYNGLSAVYSATLNQGTFQQKKDFGIPAKAMAFEFSHSSGVDGFQFNGYGVATRYLRDE